MRSARLSRLRSPDGTAALGEDETNVDHEGGIVGDDDDEFSRFSNLGLGRGQEGGETTHEREIGKEGFLSQTGHAFGKWERDGGGRKLGRSLPLSNSNRKSGLIQDESDRVTTSSIGGTFLLVGAEKLKLIDMCPSVWTKGGRT